MPRPDVPKKAVARGHRRGLFVAVAAGVAALFLLIAWSTTTTQGKNAVARPRQARLREDGARSGSPTRPSGSAGAAASGGPGSGPAVAKVGDPASPSPPSVGVQAGTSTPELMDTIDRAFKALDALDFDEARAQARECLGLNPEIMDCHHALVFSFSRNGEYTPELAQAIDDCLEFNPDDPECLETAVGLRLHAKDLAGARELLARRNEVPDLVPDYIGMAELSMASGDVEDACASFVEACRLSQEYACAMVKTLCGGTAPIPTK